MSFSLVPERETLAWKAVGQQGMLANSAARTTLLVVGGALFVALTAQIRIPLPFTPVPITGQTLGVLLVGGLLGTRSGAAALLLYLLMGFVGLPFFTGGASGIEQLFGATGGYLVAFPIAAALVGWLAERGWDRRFSTTVAAMLLGNLVIYVLGAGWLAFGVGLGLGKALTLGVLPFLIGDAIKMALAGVALPGGWKLIGKE